MHSKDIIQETTKIVQNYLTFKAVQLVIAQLAETNPKESIWLRQYSSGGKLRDAEAYIEEIMSEPRGKELALRIMTVRGNLAEQTLEFLPEMVTSSIKRDNLNHRRYLLERLTQAAEDNPDLDNAGTSEEIEDSN